MCSIVLIILAYVVAAELPMMSVEDVDVLDERVDEREAAMIDEAAKVYARLKMVVVDVGGLLAVVLVAACEEAERFVADRVEIAQKCGDERHDAALRHSQRPLDGVRVADRRRCGLVVRQQLGDQLKNTKYFHLRLRSLFFVAN